MSFQLIADHIREQREAELAHARLERLVRASRRRGPIDRLRLATARTLIAIAQAVGGEPLRVTRATRIPARPAL